MEKITSGVPESSVLGPILFSVIINDTHSPLISNISAFAPNTKLCKKANDKEMWSAAKDVICYFHGPILSTCLSMQINENKHLVIKFSYDYIMNGRILNNLNL